jgi:hypothetical protein
VRVNRRSQATTAMSWIGDHRLTTYLVVYVIICFIFVKLFVKPIRLNVKRLKVEI